MNINTIDLNLFLAFQAIYATRSVTLAGERLGMTQSAVSNALKRLRERFNDALFVRSTDGMVPTPVAERLITPIEEGLACLMQAVDQGRTFEAQTSGRTFRIAVNDIGQLVMMSELLLVARGIAPGVRFETVDVPIAEARQRMLHGQIDIALGSWEPIGPSFYQQRLFDETFVVLTSRASPLGSRDSMDLDEYLAAEHIAYRPHGTTDFQLQQTLERAGALDRRRVVLTAAHSLGLSSIVASSGLLLTAPARLAQAMVASRTDLHIVNAPFEVVPFEIRQQWHERFHQDSGNRWLRELIFGLFHQRSQRNQGVGTDT
ncbi:LysR family transcriptional regulator [Variovorax sp. Root411]|uniref:LysR family transcriptional regulator n=1 Tax=Variovorax sp. Root411 TaxID=1736530 RepID=UPI0006F21640|nr:LysR family transcriptional regulator [Variovorax sp. Root411]KQW62129.1 LysR family transcriptional regulator [Variovorax sp. Root411]